MAQKNVEEAISAVYALRLKGNSKAQSVGFFLVTNKPRPVDNEYSFSLMDLMSLNQSVQEVPKTKLQRAYWMPFIEDTVWLADEFYVYWNGFRQPNFIDDRIYAQLATAPDEVDKQMSALIVSDRGHPAWLGRRVRDPAFYQEAKALVFRWLQHGFRGSNLAGIVDLPQRLDPSLDQRYARSFSFKLEGQFSEPLDFFWALNYNERQRALVGEWEISSSSSGRVMARGPTPLKTLQNARRGYVNMSDQEAQTIFPISEQEAWFARNYRVGAPTFDMEIYHLLDVEGPIRRDNAWFRTWAKQEFSS